MENQNQEIKVRSIRADEATLDKFKALSAEFESQGDCLSQLITAYEINNAKYILTDVRADIADYESHINSIQQAFLHVLELNSNAEKRIRQEFNDLLCSKDSQIISLQERADKTEHELENANNIYQQNIDILKTSELEANRAVKTLTESLSIKIRECEQAERVVQDKQLIIDNLTSRLPEQDVIEKQLEEMKQRLNENEKIINQQKNEINELKQQQQSQEQSHKLELQKAEIEKQNAILEVKSKQQEKIDKYNSKIDKLHDEIQSLQNEYNKSISELQDKMQKTKK